MKSHAPCVLIQAVVAAAALALLAACGQSDDSAVAVPSAADAAAGLQRTAAAKPADADSELVAAVGLESPPLGSEPPFGLKFRLLQRPEVAMPLDIELVAVPQRDAQLLHVQLEASGNETLELHSDGRYSRSELKTGEKARYTVTVIPRTPGVLQLVVRAVAETNKGNLQREFAVPLIAIGEQRVSAPAKGG